MLELLAAATKLLLYAGAFAGAGVALAAASLGARLGHARSHARGIARIAAGIAMLSSAAGLLVLMFRLGGDFSGPTLSAILESPTGLATALQLGGGLGLFAFAGSTTLGGAVPALAGLGLLASFAVNGHAAAFSFAASGAAWFHVGAAAWWLGAILLLLPASKAIEAGAFAGLVRTFSRQALAVVGLLVIAGAALILTLVNFSRPDWFTPYAQILALKVLIASSVLALAAFNKLRLTPGLARKDGRSLAALVRSMQAEILLLGGVLAATAILTTYTSPHA